MDRIINIKVFGNHMTKDSKTAGVRGEGNNTKLRITFDEGWNGYAKEAVFWDAYGENPVKILLGSSHNTEGDGRIFVVPIPTEPMARAGMLTFTIYGITDNVKQVSVSGELEVKDSPTIMQPLPPSPSDLQQIQGELEYIKGNILNAVKAKESIENMRVSAERLPTGENAYVNKKVVNDVVNLHFGLPAGEKGATGSSGVYIGSEAPTDPNVNVWINENGGESNGTIGLGGVIRSVKAFGAVGDGATDDTEALKAAAACGEAVYFPKGTYLLLTQIDMSADINWIGEGAESIIKLMPYDRSRTEEYGGALVRNCYMINHPYDSGNPEKYARYSISLQSIVLDANKEDFINDYYNNGASENDHTTCLDLHNPKKVYMNNVEVRNGLIEGCYILSRDAVDITISNCNFHDNGINRVDASGLHIEDKGDNTTITNCKFNNNGFHGLLLGGITGASISNISCCNNGFGGVVLWGGASRNTLTGVYCKGNEYGVMLKSTYHPLKDEAEYDSTWMNPASNNTISGLVTELNEYGIVFCMSQNNIISGWNCIEDNYGYYMGQCHESDVTGTVLAVMTARTSNSFLGGGDAAYWKINFLGR